MNLPMIRRLITKDLRIHRWALLGLSVGVPALGLAMALSGSGWQRLGMIVMFNSMIYIQIFLPLGTILGREEAVHHELADLPDRLRRVEDPHRTVSRSCRRGSSSRPSCRRSSSATRNMEAGTVPLAAIVLTACLLSYVATSGVALVFESRFVTLSRRDCSS